VRRVFVINIRRAPICVESTENRAGVKAGGSTAGGFGFFVLLAFPALAASVIIIINEYSK